MDKEKLISVVIPMYYEEEVIEETYNQLKKEMDQTNYKYELIFVDDGSQDNTFNIVKEICNIDKNVKLIGFSKNFGHQKAVTAGIYEASGDAIVLIDGDLQDPPRIIHEMIKKWENGVDVAYGKRNKRDGESFLKIHSASMFYKFLNYMSDTDIPKDTGDFRLMDRAVANAFLDMPEHNRFIRGMVSWVGFRQEPVYYDREKRYAGVTKYPLKKMISFAADGIVSFSTKPLKLMIYLGILSVIISVGLLIYAFIIGITKTGDTGWASLMVAITFLGGMNLFSMGILGTYIGRIYDETRDRPLYIVKERVNF